MIMSIKVTVFWVVSEVLTASIIKGNEQFTGVMTSETMANIYKSHSTTTQKIPVF
jgi:hypothetical protein